MADDLPARVAGNPHPASADGPLDTRRILAWCFYDFGNSAHAMLFPTAFALFYRNQVVGKESGDLWWGATIATAMALLAVSSPLIGGIADYAGIRKRMLAIFTGLGIAAILAWTTLQPGWIILGFFLGVLAEYSFESSIVFYNTYLRDLAPPAYQGRVSAWGFGVGYVGSLVALGTAAALVSLGASSWVWFAVALQWGLASIPAFRLLPADRGRRVPLREAAREGARRTLASIREAAAIPELRWFLLAFFFYMDGVLTVVVFAASYATETLRMTEPEVYGLFAGVQVAALVGSLALARPTDVKGPRWTIRLLLVWWTLVVVGAYLAQTKTAFVVVALLVGLGLGGIQSASRALMARLIPPGRDAAMFGLFGLCGKTGSIMGPILFGVISHTIDQRAAILSVVVMFAIGGVFLSKSKAAPAT